MHFGVDLVVAFEVGDAHETEEPVFWRSTGPRSRSTIYGARIAIARNRAAIDLVVDFTLDPTASEI